MNISLSSEEMLTAVIVGARRLIVSQSKNLSNRAGATRRWDDEIEGAMAEAALARELGLYFDPRVGKYGSKDIGPYHVRHTTLNDGCLIVRDHDPDGLYVLITGSMGAYRVAGYIESDVARELTQYRKAPNGRAAAWFIPQCELTPLEVE